MKNADRWRPSKFELVGDRLRASRDVREVSPGSRLNTDLLAEEFAAAIPLYARGRLLDLGCGKVPLYGAYRAHVADVTCVDWAGSLHGNEHVDRFADLNDRIDENDAAFDTVILSDVLEHIYEPRRLTAEVARVLRPDGHLLLSVPFFYWVHESPHDYHRYTEFALRRMTEEVGLTVVHLRAYGGTPEILGDLLAKTLLHYTRFGKTASQLAQWAAVTLRRTRFGARLSQRSAGAFPLGYFLVARKPSAS